jgi:hypothetical protein
VLRQLPQEAAKTHAQGSGKCATVSSLGTDKVERIKGIANPSFTIAHSRIFLQILVEVSFTIILQAHRAMHFGSHANFEGNVLLVPIQ